ncbi:TIR domain-containing protein [Thalassospira tepidiphila]|uniref:TIR domain-containing protein n=1 Tax=Thalassospira tepidiphila TaxID=393657 RepID=UPI0030C76551
MAQCEAKTRSGRRCHKIAVSDDRFCRSHQGTFDQKSAGLTIATGVGSLIGHALAPGVGLFVGGAFGYLFGKTSQENEMAKKKVFVSFDFDNDRMLKTFIIGQSKLPDSPFEIVDLSLKEAAPEKDWERKADAAIARSDLVLVLVGPHTWKAQGVLKEIRMARARNIKIIQMIGYKAGNYTRVPDAGQLYRWSWENLKKLLAS